MTLDDILMKGWQWTVFLYGKRGNGEWWHFDDVVDLVDDDAADVGVCSYPDSYISFRLLFT